MLHIQNAILQVTVNQNKHKSVSHGVYHYVKINPYPANVENMVSS